MTHILVDGSYLCFYRYHALQKWLHHAKPEDTDEAFVQSKFRQAIRKTFQELPKKLKITGDCVIEVAKDCPRSEIWRLDHFPEYKATRASTPAIGPYFALMYEELASMGIRILEEPRMEADDCLARRLHQIMSDEVGPCFTEGPTHPRCVFIIASDKDYLQLLKHAAGHVCPLCLTNPLCSSTESTVRMFDLSFKERVGHPSDLFCKIVMGDTSDNIPPIMPRCGPKTALKWWSNPEEFEAMLSTNEPARRQYELNRLLVTLPPDLIERT